MHDESLPAENEVIVHQYGLLNPLDWAEDCTSELERMHAFKGRLVEIEHEYRISFDRLLERDPNLRNARQILDEHIRALSACDLSAIGEMETYKSIPRAGQEHSGSTPERRLTALRIQVAQAYRVARKNFKDDLNNLELERRDQVKAARQQSGLWWGNYNAVIKAFEQGRRVSVLTRGVMRVEPFDGTGRFTNQIQGGISVESLISGENIQVKVAPVPADAWSHSSRGERRRLQRTQFTATIFVRDGMRRMVTWPMIMHRPLPENVRIKEVVVSRARLDDRWLWSVVFVCTRTRVIKLGSAAAATVIAIDPGWRRTKTGLRVATIVRATGETEYFELSNRLVQAFRFADELRDRHNVLLANLRMLVSKLTPFQQAKVAGVGETCIDPANLRLPSDFRRLAKLWSLDSDYDQRLVAQISHASVEYKRLYLWERNHTRKILNHRDKLYQELAVRVSKDANEILLHKIDIVEMNNNNIEAGRDGFVPNVSNWYRRTAAISSLEHWIYNKGKRLGIRLKYIQSSFRQSCPSCGALDRKNRADTLMYICAHCDHTWDRDWGTCRMMLKDHFSTT